MRLIDADRTSATISPQNHSASDCTVFSKDAEADQAQAAKKEEKDLVAAGGTVGAQDVVEPEQLAEAEQDQAAKKEEEAVGQGSKAEVVPEQTAKKEEEAVGQEQQAVFAPERVAEEQVQTEQQEDKDLVASGGSRAARDVAEPEKQVAVETEQQVADEQVQASVVEP